MSQAVETTLLDAGAAPPVRVLSLSVPVDNKALDSTLAEAGPQFVKYVGNDKLGSLGSALGTEFEARRADAALEGARQGADRRAKRRLERRA